MKNIPILLLVFTILSSCNSTDKEKAGQSLEDHEISVSILPQEYFVRQIAGDLFKINVLIPPGASPATYEPTTAQIAALSNSSLYLRIGYTGFELAWMDKLQSTNPSMITVDLSEGIDLIMEEEEHHGHDGHHHGGIDPHIWLSPKNVITIAENTKIALSKQYPEKTDYFQSNLVKFKHRINEIDSIIQSEMLGLENVSFFTYHPSLSYYARDYGLEQLPLELGGKTPSPSHMKKLIDLGKEKKIGVVFLQLQFDQHNAEVLAKEIGAEIVQINPLDPDWDAQMLFIAKKLKEKLQ